MVSKALPMSRLTNGEVEHDLCTQRQCDSDSRRDKNLGSVGINISTCQGGHCGEESVSRVPVSFRDTADDMKKARQQKEMTHALTALSRRKLLVILEGGYNLRSISSSATAVIKVLLGESPGCEGENVVPSKSGLLTVLEVLKIQMKFWPTLEPVLAKLQSQWGACAFPNRKKLNKKRQQAGGVPVWWQWGRKRWLYHLLSGNLHLRSKGV